MSTSFYDVVVLGQDLAATVGGAVLAHRGFRVLIAGVPAEERYTIGPYSLPRAPLAFAGIEGPTLKRIVGELNLVQLLRRRLEPNRPAYQLLLPDHRIDVGDDLGRELLREMPDAAAPFETAAARAAEVSTAIEGILSQDLILPPDGFWDRRDANRVAARLPAADEDLLAALPDRHPLRAAYTMPARFGAAFDEPGAVSHRAPRRAAPARHLPARRRARRAARPAPRSPQDPLGRGAARPGAARHPHQARQGDRRAVRRTQRDHRLHARPVRHGRRSRGAARRRRRREAAQAPRRSLRDPAGGAPLRRAPGGAARRAARRARPARLRRRRSRPAARRRQRAHAAPRRRLRAARGAQRRGAGARCQPPRPCARCARRCASTSTSCCRSSATTSCSCTRRTTASRPKASTASARRGRRRCRWSRSGPCRRTIARSASAACRTDTGVKHLLLASRQVLPGLGVEGELAAGWAAARLVLQTERKRDLVKGAVLEGG